MVRRAKKIGESVNAKKDQKFTAIRPDEDADTVMNTLAERLDVGMSKLDMAILRVMIQYPGINQADIARAIGYTREWVTKRINRPAFKARLAEHNKGVLQVLMDTQVVAIKEMRKVLLDPHASTEDKIQAARIVLMPLNKVEQQQPPPMNIVYSVQFGEGGQIIRKATPLDPQRLIEEGAVSAS